MFRQIHLNDHYYITAKFFSSSCSVGHHDIHRSIPSVPSRSHLLVYWIKILNLLELILTTLTFLSQFSCLLKKKESISTMVIASTLAKIYTNSTEANLAPEGGFIVPQSNAFGKFLPVRASVLLFYWLINQLGWTLFDDGSSIYIFNYIYFKLNIC